MAFNEINNFTKIIKDLIKKEIRNFKKFDIYKVVAIDKEDTSTGFITEYKCSIKHLNLKLTYNDVPIIGIGLGNLKSGILKYPEVDDLVLVAFLDENFPIVLGTLYDVFNSSKDNPPLIRRNELFLNNKEAGAYIYLNRDNEIIIKTGNQTGIKFPKIKLYKDGTIEVTNPNDARIKLQSDGGFKIFNKNNYGIEIDNNGNMVLRGVTIDHKNTQGVY